MRVRFIGLAAILAMSCQMAFAHSLSAPDQVTVDVVKGEPIPNATFMVVSNPPDLPFEISSSASFFSISSSSNTTPATITIQFDQSLSGQLATLTGTINVSMPELLPEYDLQETVEVRLTIKELGAPPSRFGQIGKVSCSRRRLRASWRTCGRCGSATAGANR